MPIMSKEMNISTPLSGAQYSDLPFKGSRDYLHGTDTYEWIGRLAGEAGLDLGKTGLQLSFHRMFRTQLVLNGDGEEVADREEGPSVQAILRGADGEVVWDFYESGRGVDRRVPYDEDSVGANCRVEGKRIEYLGGVNFLPIEILVAMTKVLHFEVFEDRTVKWVFARLELPRFLEVGDLEGLSVEMKQAIPKRFSKSEVSSASGLTGAIYFSSR